MKNSRIAHCNYKGIQIAMVKMILIKTNNKHNFPKKMEIKTKTKL